MGKLNPARVRALKETGRYGDGGGLWLQVSKWGTKSWVLRYWIDGRERNYGLGPLELVPLGDARERAREARRLLLDGTDPIEHRRQARAARRLERAKTKTFGQCVEAFVQAREEEWTDEGAQWGSTLRQHCKPIWNLPVQAIDADLVLRCLTPIWKERTVTATRLRGRIERVLSYAKGRGLRDGENPARWDGHLSEMLPKPGKLATVKHMAAIPVDEIPAFVADLRSRDSSAARALEFVVLTAGRNSEITGATWNEIDLDERMWKVPAERMKAGKEHRVPLAARAIELLQSLPREPGNPHLFVGSKQGAGLDKNAMQLVMRELRPGYTVHGLRSSFRDWCGEKTNFPRDVAEHALAHKLPDKSERSYFRSDLFVKRIKLMEAWAKHCARPVREAANVIEMRL
jgi:integrase